MAAGAWDGDRYDRVSDPQHSWGRVVLDHLDLDGEEVVLDAGCGTGRVTEDLLRRLPEGRVVAVDGSASMLDQARRRLEPWGPRVRFVHSDLLDLEARLLQDDYPVDAVFSTATFHWISDHTRLFSNLFSLLAPGGQLVAQCGAEGNVQRVVQAARSVGLEQVGLALCLAGGDHQLPGPVRVRCHQRLGASRTHRIPGRGHISRVPRDRLPGSASRAPRASGTGGDLTARSGSHGLACHRLRAARHRCSAAPWLVLVPVQGRP